MPRMLQRWVKKGGSSSAPRVTLAAFGKHPGWDDHMPGFGIDTEVLAHLKQAFYVSGLGAQIDSGAWERLDPEKRLPGFDHQLLWAHDVDVVVGEFWSSTDRKGRSKYPMVICLHAEGVDSAALLEEPLQILGQLKSACLATTSDSAVARACQSAHEQLQAWLSRRPPASGVETPSLETRRRFLDHHTLGPDSLGLLRVVHEIDSAAGGAGHRSSEASAALDPRPYHVRVPLCSDSWQESLLLWRQFFRAASPDSEPLLLFARRSAGWLDVVLSSGEGDDLFCLQASPKALPLATQVPYELAPDTRERLDRVKATLLSEQSVRAEPPPAARREPPTTVYPAPRAPVHATPHRGVWVLLAVVALLLAVGAGVWLYLSLPAPPSSHPGGQSPPLTNDPGGTLNAAAQQQIAKAQELQAAQAPSADSRTAQTQTAASQQDVPPPPTQRAETPPPLPSADPAAAPAALPQNELQKLEAALPVKPPASDQPADTAAPQPNPAAPALAQPDDEQFQKTLQEAQALVALQDYAKAIALADAALALRPQDPVARKLKIDAENGQSLQAMAAQDRAYQTAVQGARAALAQQDAGKGATLAEAALALRPSDPTALRLKADAQALQSAAAVRDQQSQFNTALQDAQAAMNRKDYAQAATSAEAALRLRPNDAAAARLKLEAQTQAALSEALQQPGTSTPRPDRQLTLEEELAALEVRYGLRVGEAGIIDRHGATARKYAGAPSGAQRTEDLAALRRLEDGFRAQGIDRAARLQKLREAMRNGRY